MPKEKRYKVPEVPAEMKTKAETATPFSVQARAAQIKSRRQQMDSILEEMDGGTKKKKKAVAKPGM